jgi:hypothetical protein
MSDDQFRAAMEPLTSSLGRYAKAMSKLSEDNGNMPAAGSRAMAEIAAEQLWRTDEWFEPARNAHSYGGFLSHFLADHLAAYAGTIHAATVGPNWSHFTIMRAIVEAAPIAKWLDEPTITLETRLKRSIAYRLDSADQIGRMQHLPEIAAQSTETRQRCHAFARVHGWEVIKNAVGGESVPAPGKSFTAMMFDDTTGAGYTLWNLASAKAHAKWYGLADGLQTMVTPNGPLDPHGGTVALIVDGEDLTRWGVLCWQACTIVTAHRLELMGWTASKELRDATEAMTAEAGKHASLRAARDASPGSSSTDP